MLFNVSVLVVEYLVLQKKMFIDNQVFTLIEKFTDRCLLSCQVIGLLGVLLIC